LLEAAPAADIVNEDRAGGAAVVRARYRAEALRAGGIPELEFYSFSARGLRCFAVGDVHDFGGEFYANGLAREDAPFGFYKSV
jgi:hypothetical protein